MDRAHHGVHVPVLSGSLPIRRYRVSNITNTPPDYYTMIRDGLKANAYREPLSAIWSGQRSGWASVDNYLDEDPSNDCMVGEYAVFSLRIDTKAAPPARVRALHSRAVEAWKQEHNAKHIPKDVKAELKEKVTEEVLTDTSPRTKIIDVVWDTVNDWLILSHLSDGVADAFMRNFGASFPGLALELWQPFGSDEEMVSDLERTAGEFYMWLWYSIANGLDLSGTDNLDVDGKVVLAGRGGETTLQSETINEVPEGFMAMRDGKRPIMLKLRADIDGQTFAFALSGTRAFIPSLKLPEDPEKKTRIDREAGIIDRMGSYAKLHDTIEGWIKQFRTAYSDDNVWSVVSQDMASWLSE